VSLEIMEELLDISYQEFEFSLPPVFVSSPSPANNSSLRKTNFGPWQDFLSNKKPLSNSQKHYCVATHKRQASERVRGEKTLLPSIKSFYKEDPSKILRNNFVLNPVFTFNSTLRSSSKIISSKPSTYHLTQTNNTQNAFKTAKPEEQSKTDRVTSKEFGNFFENTVAAPAILPKDWERSVPPSNSELPIKSRNVLFKEVETSVSVATLAKRESNRSKFFVGPLIPSIDNDPEQREARRVERESQRKRVMAKKMFLREIRVGGTELLAKISVPPNHFKHKPKLHKPSRSFNIH